MTRLIQGARGPLLAGVLLLAGPSSLRALPEVRTPIDPAKRASVSTSDAMRPGASVFQGDGVIGGRVVKMAEIPIKMTPEGSRRSSIQISETREKPMIKPVVRKVSVRSQSRDRRERAADRPAAIPPLEAGRFQKVIAAYEDGRIPASALLQAEVGAGGKKVSIGDINRYANPRRALEAQGIPVRQAGAEEQPSSKTQPAPFPSDRKQ